MKKIILFNLLYFFPMILIAQVAPEWGIITREQANSLRTVIAQKANDSLKMGACRSLGFYYQEVNKDSSLFFHKRQLELAKKINLKLWQADAYEQIGYILTEFGNFPESLQAFQEGLKIAEAPENESSNWHVFTFSNDENSYHSRMSIVAMIYIDMAVMYRAVNDKLKEKLSFQKAIEIGEEINNGKVLALGYSNISNFYSADSALNFLTKAMHFANASGYKKYNGTILLSMAGVYSGNGRHDLALNSLYESARINQTQNNFNYLVHSLNYIARSFTFPGRFSKDSGIYYADRTLQIAQSTASPNSLLMAYGTMSDVYKTFNQIDTAYKYTVMAAALNDEIKSVTINRLSDYHKFAFNEQLRLKKIDEERAAFQNKMKITILVVGLGILLLIGSILFRNNRHKQKTNLALQKTLTDLKSTQSQLIQSEKMASLGELTAGIAHEIQNPLNFVNNFSEVNNEMVEEVKEEINKGNYDEAKVILNDIKENSEKINHHGKRADAIVKGMLQHSRSSSGVKEPADINALCDEYLRLSYHGLRAKDKSFNATMKTNFDNSIGNINIIPQDIGRVLLNLINNAFYAVTEKKNSGIAGYESTVSVSTKKINNKVEISVKDNGNGIPEQVKEKIFQPFFTTKPTGQGTGLGLSLSYDIIKTFGGEIEVETKEHEGTEFIIHLPV